jgi:LuxR family maltose regulon positive regulatory protein
LPNFARGTKGFGFSSRETLEEMATTIPNPGDNLVPRQALLKRFDDAVAGRTVFIHAPAGYGKTSLCAQWALKRGADGVLIRWIPLEEGDRDLGTLLMKLAAAAAHDGAEPPVSPLDASSIGDLSRLFVERVRLLPRRAVFFLDDYHLAESKDANELLGELLRAGSMTEHCLVVSSRARPSIPVGDLWLDGQLKSFNARDLLMSKEEIAELFSLIPHAPGAVDIEQIYRKTEGWAVAVRMAGRIAEQNADGADPLADFSGKQEDVAHYLAERLTANLSEADLVFLMQLAPLNRFDAELAGHLTGAGNFAARVTRLECMGVPFVALDHERRWLRFHPVFQDFLLSQPHADGSEPKTILLAAARWFETKGNTEAAVGHALSADASVIAVEMLERAGGWRLVYSGAGGIRRVLPAALAGLPEKEHGRFPRSLLGNAVLLAKHGDLLSSRRAFENAGRTIPEKDAALQREFRLIGQLLALYADTPASRAEFDQLAADLDELTRDNTQSALTLNLLCFLCLQFGELERALEHGAAAVDEFRRAGAFFGAAHLHTHMGQAHLFRIEIDAARAAYAQMAASVRQLLGEGSDLEAMARVLDAEALAEEGEFSQAAADVLEFLPQLEEGDCWFDILAAGYLTQLRIHLIDGRLSDAHRVLDRAAMVAQQRHYPRLARLVERERVFLLAHSDMPREARSFAKAHGLDELSAADRRRNDLNRRLRGNVPALLWARIHHAEGDHGAALHYLDRLSINQTGGVTPLRRVRLSLLKIRFLLAAGREHEAGSLLDEVLLTPSVEKTRASFVEEGDAVAAWLEKRRGEPGMPAIQREKLSALLCPAGRGSLDSGLPNQDFTDREISVLKLVATGLSNKEIARALAISDNTIKFHLKNVFRKLHRSNRIGALAAARELGLLDG